MKNHRIALIAAIGAGNRVIGNNNQLLWKIPEDMKRFKTLTAGRPVIMGRKTWESIPLKFRPLPGRTNLVITRQKDYVAEGSTVCNSLEEAVAEATTAPGAEELFVIGGAQIYEEALSVANRLYLTIVYGNYSGDAFFPAYETIFTKKIEDEGHIGNDLKFDFQTLER